VSLLGLAGRTGNGASQRFATVGETVLVATMAREVELISVKLVKQEPGYEINKKSSDCDMVPIKEA
jgi:hypothetical protein